jgi:hypothetical protein
MHKNIINEVSRMKDLLGYKKGQVISEQSYIIKEAFDFAKYPCINTEWERKKGATGTNGPSELGIEFVTAAGPGRVKNPTGNNYFDFKDISFSEQGEWYFLAYQKGKFSCNGKQILFDGKPMEGALQPKGREDGDPNSPQTLKNVTVYGIPKSLGNVEGVKKFQDWLDQTHAGWHKKYKTLNQSVAKGYGKFGPNTSGAWTTYGEEYKKTLTPVEQAKLTSDATTQTPAPTTQTQQQYGITDDENPYLMYNDNRNFRK